MTGPDRLRLTALLGSGALLLGAFWAERVWGLPPCPLCLWQRAAHLIALIGAVGFLHRRIGWEVAGVVGTGLSGIVGLYQAGAEAGWWALIADCGGAPDLSGLSPEAALARMLEAAPPACDAALWSFAGLSLAGWNAALSGPLLLIWLRLLFSAPLSRSGR